MTAIAGDRLGGVGVAVLRVAHREGPVRQIERCTEVRVEVEVELLVDLLQRFLGLLQATLEGADPPVHDHEPHGRHAEVQHAEAGASAQEPCDIDREILEPTDVAQLAYETDDSLGAGFADEPANAFENAACQALGEACGRCGSDVDHAHATSPHRLRCYQRRRRKSLRGRTIAWRGVRHSPRRAPDVLRRSGIPPVPRSIILATRLEARSPPCPAIRTPSALRRIAFPTCGR
jgi:hypothetical protein